MLKSFALVVAFGAGVGFACTIPNASYRIDTVSPGVTRVIQTNYSGYIPNQTVISEQVRGPYLQSDLKIYLSAVLRDSAVVFFAHIDSIVNDTNAVVTPEVVLTSPYSTQGQGAVSEWVRVRIRVDSLLRGTLPGRTFWVKTHMLNSAMCGTRWDHLKGRTFLNAAGGLSVTDHLKLPYSFTLPLYNDAHWFDGRYLVAPDFPGLRLDITELYPDYPATSVVPRRLPPLAPLRPDGKIYRPDGRTVNPDVAPKSPMPLLR